MFQNRWRPPRANGEAPSAMQWWERSFGARDATEQLARLRQELGAAIADVEHSKRPVFLRALGKDLDRELGQLAQRAAFVAREATSQFAQRCDLLEEMVEYYCDAVVPSGRVFDAIDLSDCAREAVARLSGDMILVLRIQSEPHVLARRRPVISLFEVAIRAASARPEDEVEVILAACSDRHAEFRVSWPRTATSEEGPRRHGRDDERFFALAVACALKVGATLSRHTGVCDNLVVRIPMPDASPALALEPDVVEQATAFFAES